MKIKELFLFYRIGHRKYIINDSMVICIYLWDGQEFKKIMGKIMGKFFITGFSNDVA